MKCLIGEPCPISRPEIFRLAEQKWKGFNQRLLKKSKEQIKNWRICKKREEKSEKFKIKMLPFCCNVNSELRFSWMWCFVDDVINWVLFGCQKYILSFSFDSWVAIFTLYGSSHFQILPHFNPFSIIVFIFYF